MRLGVGDEKRNRPSVQNDPTAEISLFTFFKPNAGVYFDEEVRKLRRKIRAGFGCHISCRTFNDVHAARHKKWWAREDLHLQGSQILDLWGLLFPLNHSPRNWCSQPESH